MSLHEDIAKAHPSLERGRVWCRTCGRTEKVDTAECLRSGWPKCCGATMSIDSPEEQAATDEEAWRLEREAAGLAH